MRRLTGPVLLVALALAGTRSPGGVAQEATPRAGLAGTPTGAFALSIESGSVVFGVTDGTATIEATETVHTSNRTHYAPSHPPLHG